MCINIAKQFQYNELNTVLDLVAGMQDIDTSDDKTKENQTLTHVHRHCYHSDLALAKHSPCNLYVYPSAMRRRLEEVTKKYKAFLHSKNKDGFFICT